MKCKNECGELIELKKPALVAIGAEVSMYTDIEDPNDEIPAFSLIYRVCSECGYYEHVQINQDQFELYCQGKLKINQPIEV